MIEQTVDQAVAHLAGVYRENYDHGLCGLPEACDYVNDASRDVIDAVYQKNNRECWLVVINPFGSQQRYRRHDGGMVYNFGADYVIPKHDERVQQLCEELAKTEGIKSYHIATERLVARIKEVGGITLAWS